MISSWHHVFVNRRYLDTGLDPKPAPGHCQAGSLLFSREILPSEV
jgi:hypothetical protein